MIAMKRNRFLITVCLGLGLTWLVVLSWFSVMQYVGLRDCQARFRLLARQHETQRAELQQQLRRCEDRLRSLEYFEMAMHIHTRELSEMGLAGLVDKDLNVVAIARPRGGGAEGAPIPPEPALCVHSCYVFTRLKKLREAHLGLVDIPDEGLKYLSECPSLEFVNLSFTPITDVGLRHLSKCTSVNVLWLAGLQNITDEGAAELAGMINLVQLSLRKTNIGDKALAGISKLKSLRALDVSETRVTAAGLAQLANCPSLETLVVSCDQLKPIEALRLDSFKRLKHLEVVDIRNLSQADLDKLQAALPACRIDATHDKWNSGSWLLERAYPGTFYRVDEDGEFIGFVPDGMVKVSSQWRP